jgi:uncharacterized protein YqeY
MSLEKTINKELVLAMKAKDAISLRGIRAIKAAILLTKTDGSGSDLDTASEIKLLQKLVKQRNDSYDIYVKQNREDLAKIEKEEIEIITRFLPAQLSAEEISAIVKQIVTETGASSMKDMGRVMGMASKKLAGKADGKTIASIVKSLLSS